MSTSPPTVQSAASSAMGLSILQRPISTLASRRSAYLLGAVLIAIIVVMVLPVLMSFLASIKTPAEASAVPPTYIPHHLSLANYAKVFSYQAGLASYIGNSLTVAALTILFCLVLAIPAGYGLARLRLPARDLIFLLLLLPLMIPYQALLTPLYLMFSGWGLANSYLGLAVIHTILQLPFSVYLLRQNFESVPREFEEAAMVDGCSEFRMLWSIHLPAVRPAIVTVVLFAFVASWNEFIGALIEMGQESKFTVPIMLVAVRMGNHGAVDWGALQAGVIISILPCFLIYMLLQKYYVSGLLSGAIK